MPQNEMSPRDELQARAAQYGRLLYIGATIDWATDAPYVRPFFGELLEDLRGRDMWLRPSGPKRFRVVSLAVVLPELRSVISYEEDAR